METLLDWWWFFRFSFQAPGFFFLESQKKEEKMNKTVSQRMNLRWSDFSF